MNPGSTYRVQLQRAFPFASAARLVPTLARLGITHLYCSPLLQSVRGSTHGYDVVDPTRIDEELGGAAGFEALCTVLREHGLGLVLDVVPNHMAASAQNPWWWDVLEDGPASVHARCFDVGWKRTEYKREADQVLVPVLADHYGRVLEEGGLSLAHEAGRFVVRYHEHVLPVALDTLPALLEPVSRRSGSEELEQLVSALRELGAEHRGEGGSAPTRDERKRALAARLDGYLREHAPARRELRRELEQVNADSDRLDGLLRAQSYRLAYWRTATEELDYRRFFSIDSLVGLRVEDEAVFQASHALVLELVRSGRVEGLRIDHVDGLRDPRGYLERLRAAAPEAWIVVEKILALDEELPEDWPVDGTTGYEFLARVDALFVAAEQEPALSACYQRFTGREEGFAELVHACALQVMEEDLRAEVSGLVRRLAELCERHRRQRDHTRRELREALQEWLACFDVYRTYVQPGRATPSEERARVHEAVRRARERRPELDAELLEFLGQLALLEHEGEAERDFALRLAQVTPAVRAKSVEDTAFYRDQRLIALDEVGNSPARFGISPEDFHARSARVARRRPATQLTLSTHDTKRSADVRARLVLLSEIPAAWERALGAFARTNERHRHAGLPDRNAEYLLYQTLVGAWPIEAERVLEFSTKAAREAKEHSSWSAPCAEYEDALRSFAAGALADAEFVAQLETFLGEQRLVERGRLVSLAQTTLLLTSPGVPDLYQGNELWDLSLVDPDNRRPVDFALRARLLAELDERPPRVPLAEDELGLAKLWLVQRLLGHRRRRPAPYASPLYEPLQVRGPRAANALAFARDELVVLVPRLVFGLAEGWGESVLPLPEGSWRDVLGSGRELAGAQPVAELTRTFPVVVLERG